MFNDIYRGKKILITGHTGFKGAWLTTWMLKLGAHVVGVSKDIPTKPSIFEELELAKKIKDYVIDIRSLESLQKIISEEKPDFVFHLAAQPIVAASYSDPIETIGSNVIGTTNVLESLRISNHKCTAIIITSDKAYDNVEQVWGYKETDQMGGKDIYSGSKGAAELIIKSYFHSFFKNKNSNVAIAIGRAGNVIGGGDWAQDRIVADCMRSWSQKKTVEIRSPKATRPWQHVLEPLSGYLNLGQRLFENQKLHGEAFNFGPRAEQNHTVQQLIADLSVYWEFKNGETAFVVTDHVPFHEAGLLKLNCDKALAYLQWQATLAYEDTIRFTSEWYRNFYSQKSNMYEATLTQIKEYEGLASRGKLAWVK